MACVSADGSIGFCTFSQEDLGPTLPEDQVATMIKNQYGDVSNDIRIHYYLLLLDTQCSICAFSCRKSFPV